jgi:hypothetical protein
VVILSTAALAKAPAKGDLLRTSTLRDFSGLWNTADNDLNLKPKFAARLTNIERGTDGALKVRYGYRLFCDVAHPRHQASVVVKGEIGTNQLVVQWASHGLSAGSVVRLTNLTASSYMGVSATILTSYLPVAVIVDAASVVDKDQFLLQLPQFTSGTAVDITCGIDEGPVLGSIIDCEYFEGFLVVITDQGYAASIDSSGAARVIWSPLIGNVQTITQQQSGTRLSTTVGSSRVSINSGFTVPPMPVGGIIKLSNYGDVGGIPATEINRTHIIIAISGSNYVIQLLTVATLTTAFNGRLFYSLSTAWHTPFYCSHAIFNRQLILCNGIDKPLFVDFENNPVCQFLVDPAGPTNINTPIGLYVAAGDNYTVIAGNALEPGTIYISSQNTNCVFVGDGAPNDATNVDVSKLVNTPTPTITGLAFHRGLLFVAFENFIVPIKLGTYDASNNHIPAKEDVIANYGCVAHKSMLSIGTHFFVCDFSGVVDVQRNIFQNLYNPQHTSEVIAPHIARTLSAISLNDSRYKTWAMYDKRENRYWLSVARPDGHTNTYVYTFLEERKVFGWQLFVDLDWSCGCRSEFDRLFGCRGTKVFIHGNDTDPLYSDDAVPIRFVFETPWIDFEKRSTKKQSRYLAMDSDGTAQYQVALYVDRIYDDVLKLDTDLAANSSITYDDFSYPTTPEIVAQLTAGRGPGWSRGPQPYGGGRRTSRAGLIAFPTEFDICKVRVSGSATGLFKLVSLSILYLQGSIRRGG